LLNATPIASGYAGRDPQIGTAIKVFSNFLLKTGLKVFLLSFWKERKSVNVRRGEKKIEEDGVIILIKKTMLKEKEWKRKKKQCWL